MKKITWYLNRLKAMNMGEICWRFQQKNLQKQERRKYYKEDLPVYEFKLPDELKNLNAVQEVADALGDTGRILVRESGTEPLIRVMVEAETKEICRRYVDNVVSVIKEKETTR